MFRITCRHLSTGFAQDLLIWAIWAIYNSAHWPASIVHAEYVDVPGHALGLHHLPEQLPGHVALAEDHSEVECGLAPEGEAKVQAIRGQVSDLSTGTRAHSHV